MASMEKVGERGGEGVYRIRWRVAGRQVEKRIRGHDNAKAYRARVQADENDGTAPDPRAGTRVLNEYFTEWVASRLVKGRPLRPSTRDGYERLWRRNIAHSIGQRQLRAIRPDTVRDWHGTVTREAGRDQAAKSYRLLRAVLATAESDDLIRGNPCRIRGAGQEQPEERPLASTSLVLELAEAIGDRYRAIVLVVGFLGTRTGEVLGLRRCDVDLVHAEMHVRVQAQELKSRGRTQLDYTKTDAGRRPLAIPQLVLDALEHHLGRYTAADADAPVFSGPEGGPLRRATLSTAWRAAKRSTGAPENLRLYDLRHHAATLTARKPGITTKELMAQIGHKSWAAAIRYQHAAEDRNREVATFIDAQIAAAKPQKPAPVVPPGNNASDQREQGGN
jgi:integrase